MSRTVNPVQFYDSKPWAVQGDPVKKDFTPKGDTEPESDPEEPAESTTGDADDAEGEADDEVVQVG